MFPNLVKVSSCRTFTPGFQDKGCAALPPSDCQGGAAARPQVDADGSGQVSFWTFLGIRLYWALRLRLRGIPLAGWLAFCTQLSPLTGTLTWGTASKRRGSKPWHRHQGAMPS